MYTIDELVKAARTIFQQSGALVAAALQSTGRDKFTLEDAQDIVEEFAKREVKN